ncbi:hypothetical protein ABT297_13900 [Dactylosporangium sp. NPDC000555]|uniref:phosphotransferase family protein n=1 Tax=Dactylosporangium sp. NPDC000555 TaxID=3154260 RepID=UPI00333067D0
MAFQSIERAHVQVSSAVELGAGMYNNTYRVQVRGRDQPVVLRVAPPAAKQFRSERELMRNEYATVPWLTSIAPLMPQVVAADWSHEVIDRDYLVQTLLDGVPAPDHLGSYPRTTWPHFSGSWARSPARCMPSVGRASARLPGLGMRRGRRRCR